MISSMSYNIDQSGVQTPAMLRMRSVADMACKNDMHVANIFRPRLNAELGSLFESGVVMRPNARKSTPVERNAAIPARESSMGEDMDRLLSVKLVSQLLGVCSRTIWRLVASGELTGPVHVAGASRWPATEVSAYIEALKQQRKPYRN